MTTRHTHYVQLPNLGLAGLEADNKVTKRCLVELAAIVGTPADALAKLFSFQAFGADDFENITYQLKGHNNATTLNIDVTGTVDLSKVKMLPAEEVQEEFFSVELGNVGNNASMYDMMAKTAEEAQALVEKIIRRTEHHQLTLNIPDVKEILSSLECRGHWYNPCFAYDCSEEELFSSIDSHLEYFGNIEGTFLEECPICNKSGSISTPKHHSCFVKILTSNKGTCSNCDKQAETVSEWKPMCNCCAERSAAWNAALDD
ncbi:MAG: hypothetical protein Q7U16_14820 [Agitococcus sp.]|nr:hypothetical protein [Agitococcus sp.]